MKKPRKQVYIAALILAAIVLSSWQYARVSSVFFGAVSALARPLWSASAFASYVATDTLKTKGELELENAALTAEVANRQGDHVRVQLLAEENAELKNILGRENPKEHMTVAAVVARPPQSPYDTLVIDGGTQAGFSVGDTVVADGSIALGTISAVSSDTAKADLYSMPGGTMTVMLGPKNISTQASGRGGGNFIALVPRDAEVAKGDVVIFPGLSAKVLGEVSATIMRSSDTFKSVYFRIPVNISELRWVEVLKK